MLPQVSFYILADDSPLVRGRFACRLAEKAWKNNVKTHIHLSKKEDIEPMSDLLWSFREDSFVPHATSDSDEAGEVPVTISCSEDDLQKHDGLLINLGDIIPDNINHFSRVAEVVVQSPEILELARVRFRQYRDRGMHPQHQKVGQSA
ncbi:DNA polymerase III subunit chi [Parendozoicomonas haliclonae]|nr:DNA polymerase III subunit chi [Parendozoicomonas haliclonae]